MATKAPQGSGRKSTKGQRNDKLFVLNPETLRDIIRAEKPRVMDVFHHFDTDHDGKVSMTELIVGVQSVFAAAEEDVIRGLFSRADKDGSGEIGFDELDDLFRHWDQNDEDNARRVAVESKTKRDPREDEQRLRKNSRRLEALRGFHRDPIRSIDKSAR